MALDVLLGVSHYRGRSDLAEAGTRERMIFVGKFDASRKETKLFAFGTRRVGSFPSMDGLRIFVLRGTKAPPWTKVHLFLTLFAHTWFVVNPSASSFMLVSIVSVYCVRGVGWLEPCRLSRAFGRVFFFFFVRWVARPHLFSYVRCES